MKSSMANQTTLGSAVSCWHSAKAGMAVVGAVTVLLLGITTTRGGQAAASSVQFRPIEDFLEAQGSLGIPFDYAAASVDRKTMRLAYVDYAGIASKRILDESGGSISLGTEVEGTVAERPLAGGGVEVTVLLHTRNALTWVAVYEPDNVPPWGVPLFGYFPEEVLAGAEPALGDSILKWVFINDAPGAPLPDLLAQVFEPTVKSILFSITASAEGALREAFGVADGTLGRMQATQVAPMSAPGLDTTVTGGKWPTEHINLKVVGR